MPIYWDFIPRIMVLLSLSLALDQRLHWVSHESSLSRENRSDSLSQFQEYQMSTLKQKNIIDFYMSHEGCDLLIIYGEAALTLSL